MLIAKLYCIFIILSVIIGGLAKYNKDQTKKNFLFICLFIPILVYLIVR